MSATLDEWGYEKSRPHPLYPDAETRRVVINGITDLSLPRRSFYLLVVLSTTIAAYGLLANSTAVVIGAMLNRSNPPR